MENLEQLASEPQIWQPPKEFGDYVLEEKLDDGGMGAVYKALCISQNQKVAIKFMIKSFRNKAEYKRFQREAIAGSRLNHRNFVRFRDTGDIDGNVYIVMDYIAGEPLKRYLEKYDPGAQDRILLFLKIVRAIAYAHSQGVIHRDLKPANIVIDREQEPVILDFGLSKYTEFNYSTGEKDPSTCLTMDGQIIGTPGYMAPEQAQGRIEEQDERTDIFSLGIIFYEMLTARNPFGGGDFLEICYRIAHQGPIPIRSLLPSIPEQLEYIIEQALAKDKHNRYQTANDFAEDVQSFLNSTDTRKSETGRAINQQKTVSHAVPGSGSPPKSGLYHINKVPSHSMLQETIEYPPSDSGSHSYSSQTGANYPSSPNVGSQTGTNYPSSPNVGSQIRPKSTAGSGLYAPMTEQSLIRNVVESDLDSIFESFSETSEEEIVEAPVEEEPEELPILNVLPLKILCTACAHLNPSTSRICQKCNTPITKKLPSSPPDGVEKPEIVTARFQLKKLSKLSVPTETREIKLKEESKPTALSQKEYLHFFWGACGMILAAVPAMISIKFPLYCLVVDAIWGGSVELYIRKYKKTLKGNALIFTVAGMFSMLSKYYIGWMSNPFTIFTCKETSVALVLFFAMGLCVSSAVHLSKTRMRYSN